MVREYYTKHQIHMFSNYFQMHKIMEGIFFLDLSSYFHQGQKQQLIKKKII